MATERLYTRVGCSTVYEVSIQPSFVTVQRASELTGYTQKAIRRKIEEGIWREGVMWLKAPDGRILIDMEAYQKWVKGELSEA